MIKVLWASLKLIKISERPFIQLTIIMLVLEKSCLISKWNRIGYNLWQKYSVTPTFQLIVHWQCGFSSKCSFNRSSMCPLFSHGCCAPSPHLLSASSTWVLLWPFEAQAHNHHLHITGYRGEGCISTHLQERLYFSHKSGLKQEVRGSNH